jgi:PTS system D-glucosamine-specific IIC component
MSTIYGTLQKIGKALMLPVSVLPIAGLLLGVGSANFGWLPAEVSQIMAQSGGAIFGNLALIFAIGVAIGLSNNDGVASIAASVGFVVLLGTMGVVSKIMGIETKSIMGIDSVETGVFGGIISGLISSILFNKYYRIKLPDYLGFFSGKRFVPIITAFVMIFVGIIMSFVWPPVQGVIDSLSHYAVNGNPNGMVFLYGFVERLLIPFGLHHIWNVPFFFEIGEFTNAAGEVVSGDITRFFAGDKTAGFLGGGFLFKMFGLPAAAIAIWHSAKPENKTAVGSIMVSAAFTSFLTGITEPIEFAFLFVAPVLYGIHALFAGLCFTFMNVMGAKLGFTFSHGLIDFALYYALDTKPWIVLIAGPITGAIYYFSFRFAISKFNLLTPGRDEDSSTSEVLETSDKAMKILAAFGGSQNIKALDACITRLRISVHNPDLVFKDELTELGASGVIFLGENIQAIFGTSSDVLKSEMDQIIRTGSEVKRASEINFVSPMSGDILPLSSVPDKVFSEALMGPGYAIKPTDGKVYSPFDAEVVSLFKTNHAIGLKSECGREVLIHFGIDTVKLKGENFKALVEKGNKVSKGQLLLDIDLDFVTKNAPSSITPIIFTKNDEVIELLENGSVRVGQENTIKFKNK